MEEGWAKDNQLVLQRQLKEEISLFRMKTLEKALYLEIKGLKRGGRSAYSIIKEEYSLKGSRQTVLNKVKALYEDNVSCLRDAYEKELEDAR